MKPRKATYVLHRWLALALSLQLLAWSTGGFVFSVLSIESVRGETDIASPSHEPLASVDGLPPPVHACVSELLAEGRRVGPVALVDRGLGRSWEVRDVEGALLVVVDPASGTARPPISREDAESLARRDFAPAAGISHVELIENGPPLEYRGKPLPAWRVELDHARGTHLYLDARSGEVTARRNRRWRVFDFFWMLHTMDYRGRDDFNHALLTSFSVLAILTSLSGLALWGWRLRSRRGPLGPRTAPR